MSNTLDHINDCITEIRDELASLDGGDYGNAFTREGLEDELAFYIRARNSELEVEIS